MRKILPFLLLALFLLPAPMESSEMFLLPRLLLCPSSHAEMIVRKCQRASIPAHLVLQIVERESGMDPDVIGENLDAAGNVKSRDFGLGQLNTATIKLLGIEDPLNPEQNIDGVVTVMQAGHEICGSWSRAMVFYAIGRCAE